MGEVSLRKLEKKLRHKKQIKHKNTLEKEQKWKRWVVDSDKVFPGIIKTLFGGPR